VGESLSVKLLAAGLRGLSEEHLEELLEELSDAHLVVRTEVGDWVLARDLAEVDLLELYRAGSFVLPQSVPEDSAVDDADRALWVILQQMDQGQRQAMAVPLASMFQGRQCVSDRGN